MKNSLPYVFWEEYYLNGEPGEGYDPILGKLVPGPYWHDQFGRFYPDPDDLSVWVNPPRSRVRDPLTGDVVEIVFDWSSSTDAQIHARTVLHYVITNTLLEPTTQEVANGFAEELADVWQDTRFNPAHKRLSVFTPANYGIKSLHLRNLSKPGEEATATTSLPLYGTTPLTTPLDIRTAMLVRKSIVAGGKVGAPCLRWPYIDKNVQRAGIIDHAPLIATFNQWINDYREVNEIVSGKGFTSNMYVLQREASRKAKATIVSLVTSLAIEPILSSVRSRKATL